MAMPKVFGQIFERLNSLETLIEMLGRIEGKIDRLITLLETQPSAPPAAPIVQVDETTAAKMEKAGDFKPARGKK